MAIRIGMSAMALGLLVTFTSVGLVGQTAAQSEALRVATTFINDNCQRPLARGTETTISGSGEIDLRLQGLAKMIAGAGGKVGGTVQQVTWDGATKEQFAAALKSGNECGVEMAKLLVSIGLIPKAPDILSTLNLLSTARDAPVEVQSRDEFSSAGDWWIGQVSGQFGSVSRRVDSGVYDWELRFDTPVSSFPVTAPYPATRDFTVAVDVGFFDVLPLVSMILAADDVCRFVWDPVEQEPDNRLTTDSKLL